MKRIFTFAILTFAAIFSFSSLTSAQLKARKPVKRTDMKKTLPPPSVAVENQVSETVIEKTPVKKNERPESSSESIENQQTQEGTPQKKNQSPKTSGNGAASKREEPKNVFSYEFTQPDFVVSRIIINHDETGKGTITIEKRNFGGEGVTDPIQLSSVSLERLKNLFETLKFIDSTEEYQSTSHQFPHLGTMKIGLKKDGRERTVKFNWTEDKDAKALADEYRRIGEQFVWIFDMSVALENQPLEAPGLMDALDSLLKRDQISDPLQMLPLLKKLTDDERIPLIARNHATRLVKEIEKKAAK